MRGIDADIYSICETHLSGQNIIEIDSYTWIGYNRRDIHRDAPKSSGGVGILIKQWVCDTYNISVIDKTVDGILGVKYVIKKRTVILWYFHVIFHLKIRHADVTHRPFLRISWHRCTCNVTVII